MADKYYRLVSFLVNICPQPLRELFIKYMNADPKRAQTCSTVGAYLTSRKSQLLVLKNKKLIRQEQWELLFPSARGQVADESSWDTTLLTLLLDEFFRYQLKQVEEDAIQRIRAIRNRLQHFAETSIDDADFDNMWTILESATLDLAKQIQPSPMYVDTIQEYIDDSKINNMPKLGDTLRYFYESIIMKLKADMEDMKEIMNEISENTSKNTVASEECRNILRGSTVKTVRPTGEKVKKMKTVDHILTRLNENFTTTMKEDLAKNYNSPPEVSDIETKLREDHHVVVTGFKGGRYLEAALVAIKSMNYNHNRCVEMRNSSDWRHIDPDEVDLVLCREPFGDFTFDEEKTKRMADVFNNMLQAAKDSGGNECFDIVIVVEIGILQQVKNYREHDLLEEAVKLYQPTTELEPADLTGTCGNCDSDFDQATRNQLELSAAYCKQYKGVNLHPTEALDEAKATLKRSKVLVLTGPRKCGKTTLALTLASKYQTNQFLVVNKPDDMKLIRIGSICTVLIEDFAGKYYYDDVHTQAWLKEFDLLYSAVLSGKLNVIITCEETNLLKCKDKNESHPILQNPVVLKSVNRIIKNEPTGVEDIADTAVQSEQSCTAIMEINHNMTSNESEKGVEKKTHTSHVFNNIKDISSLNENTILFLSTTGGISLLDRDLDVKSRFTKKDEQLVDRLCCLNNNTFLLVSGTEVSVFELFSDKIQPDEIHLLRKRNLGHECDFISAGKNEMISILHENIIYEYDNNLDLDTKKIIPLKSVRDCFVTGAAIISDQQCAIIVKPNSVHSIKYKKAVSMERILYLEEKKMQPIAVCAGQDNVFILCLKDNGHTKVMNFGLNLEKIGEIKLNDVFYTPYNVTSMMYDSHSSRILVTYCGKLDAFPSNHQLIGKDPVYRMNNHSTPLFTRVKEIQTYEIDRPDKPHIKQRPPSICQLPDGSYLLVCIERKDTPNVYALHGPKVKIVLQHISSDFKHKCYYDTVIYFEYGHCIICCSDTGDVVIAYDKDIRLYRISNGTLQLILSKQLKHYTGAIYFHRSRFIRFDNNGHCLILDKTLNVKREVLLVQHVMTSEESFVFQPCSQHLYFSFISDENLEMFCEDTRLQQIKYLRKENFYPKCMCAATDDSVFVYGEQDNHSRIIQVNSDMTVLLDLCTEKRIDRYEEYAKMLYDRPNGRLVLNVSFCGEKCEIIAIDLE